MLFKIIKYKSENINYILTIFNGYFKTYGLTKPYRLLFVS